MKNILLVIFLFAVASCSAQSSLNIIPEPAKVEMKQGSFVFSSKVDVIYNDSVSADISKKIIDTLKKRYSIQTTLASEHPYHESYQKVYIDYEETYPQKEGYKLDISENEIHLSGRGAGLFYGMQTIFQLLPLDSKSSVTIPCANIIDSPRFAYRGLHLDCGRHFFSVDFIKQYIDFIAMHKMNTFHWHLTEDQGWRIEIKKYPKLTQIGACRNGTIIGHHPGTGNDNTKYCGYYTQAQIKDIVKYAAERYITIIPEIEMPGHASAAIAAYPQLSCFPDSSTKIAKGVKWSGDSTGKQVQQSWGVYPDVFAPTDYTFKFLENVLDEVMQLFPSKYIHIGGDECPKIYWKESAFCQQLIKDSGLKDEEGLQSYFIRKIERYLNSKGHSIIGWDEILEGGVAPNATIMSWRGEKGGIEAAQQHHQVIMTPTTYVYFDYSQTKHNDSLVIGGYLPVETVYKYEPLPSQLSADEQKYIIGAQANVWTEYMSNPAKVEYMLFPRLDALSEVLWTPKENKNWDDFKNRLQQQYKRYDLRNVHYNAKGIDKDK
jgi:hexosaminidase